MEKQDNDLNKPAGNVEHHEEMDMAAPEIPENLTAIVEDVSYGPGGIRGIIASPYVFGAAFLASLGGFSFGYDQGVISIINVMDQFTDQYPGLKNGGFWTGFMTAMLELGAFLGCFFMPWLADKVSHCRSELRGPRVATLALGALLYISEISPPHLRGALLVLESVSIVLGAVVSYWITYATRHMEGDVSFRLPCVLWPLAIWGAIGMATPYIIMSALVGEFSHDWPGHKAAGWVTCGFAYVYILAYGVSYSPLAWALPAEVFSNSTRAKGVALSTATVWLCNFIIGVIVPTMSEDAGFGTYGFFAIMRWQGASVWQMRANRSTLRPRDPLEIQAPSIPEAGPGETKMASFDFIAENGIDYLDTEDDDEVAADAPIHADVVPRNGISLDADIILDPALDQQTSTFQLNSHEIPGSISPFTSLTTSASWIADLERLHSIAVSTPPSIANVAGQAGNQWPLPIEEEAMLLRYFYENVSHFFDVSEPIQYFRIDIPQRARTNTTLANAILALSSRILQWKNGYNPHVADRYYQRCLEALIPALNDETLVMDETLLAATIFLRMLEEMDSFPTTAHISGFDDGGHLSGTQAIISVATNTYGHVVPTGFRLAAYWTAFRQELWLALHKQQPVTMSVRRVCGFDDAHGFAPAPDWIWCQRAIAHCADVLDCAFGNFEAGKEEAAKRWKWLVDDNARWWAGMPKSFEPFYGTWDDTYEGKFPDIRLHLEWHVMGYAYTILARLLLIVHDPTIPTLGPQRRQAVAEIDLVTVSRIPWNRNGSTWSY
ncbi:putative mfs monosaccharide transporter protein [Botryosphaeria dothidea]|uniref:Mfs monosaccharide transporter protein n=1 Tax=Botryosphaeria dothidea TaxID=55169 RepID=A0A8H4J955_9PEZI|nr:putative mfs monosaccharide transporter protein [Botryosphaeria dothidea]